MFDKTSKGEKEEEKGKYQIIFSGHQKKSNHENKCHYDIGKKTILRTIQICFDLKMDLILNKIIFSFILSIV